jgi:nitrate/TMAO reductase-like tetraheme cytochrome c subunit
MTSKKTNISKAILVIALYMALPLNVAGEEFQISHTCTECHQDRYNEWSRSMHALSVSDPIFRSAYTKAIIDRPEYREYCMSCHSPTSIKTNDFNVSKSISLEGVTCSFCHSVTGVEKNNYSFNAGNPMQGPYKDSNTDAHGSTYSELLTKSEFCAGCHEFSMNGLPISETYSEWKEGPYAAEGIECQDCHMEVMKGQAAKNEKQRENVYSHFWYGGHSGQFLEKAFKIKSNIQQNGKKARVTISITNSNVGHKTPSGLPTRKIILNFRATNGTGFEIFGEKRVYAKTLLDQYGNEVNDFWKASSIGKDNRIKPKETRIEVFEFDIQEGIDKLNIAATLNYQLEADIITTSKETMDVEIARIEETRSLIEKKGADSQERNKSSDIGLAGSIIAIFTAILIIRRKTPKIK